MTRQTFVKINGLAPFELTDDEKSGLVEQVSSFTTEDVDRGRIAAERDLHVDDLRIETCITEDGEYTEYTVKRHDAADPQPIPKAAIDRTNNLLGEHPMTNQRIILATAEWWLRNAGPCPIYKWCIHHLDMLENNDHAIGELDVYRDAKEQAESIGFFDWEEDE